MRIRFPRLGECDSSGAPILEIVPSNVEDGVDLTIGNRTLHLTREQSLDLATDILRTIGTPSEPSTAQLDAQDQYGFRDRKG